MSTRGTTLSGAEFQLVRTETISTARTLTSADSGKKFTLSAAAGVAITLPSVAVDGFNARFTIGSAFATTNFTIVSTTNVIQGSADVNSTLVPASNENTISFVASAETIGDYIEIYSDGTNFYAYGIGQAAGGITFTAV
jgi:hypothetical protein